MEVPGPSDLAVGDVVDVSVFVEGDLVKVTGVSKGKGFRVWSSDTASRVDRGAMALTSVGPRFSGRLGGSFQVFPGTTFRQMGNDVPRNEA